MLALFPLFLIDRRSSYLPSQGSKHSRWYILFACRLLEMGRGFRWCLGRGLLGGEWPLLLRPSSLPYARLCFGWCGRIDRVRWRSIGRLPTARVWGDCRTRKWRGWWRRLVWWVKLLSMWLARPLTTEWKRGYFVQNEWHRWTQILRLVVHDRVTSHVLWDPVSRRGENRPKWWCLRTRTRLELWAKMPGRKSSREGSAYPVS